MPNVCDDIFQIELQQEISLIYENMVNLFIHIWRCSMIKRTVAFRVCHTLLQQFFKGFYFVSIQVTIRPAHFFKRFCAFAVGHFFLSG